jgi:hypothetical protein
MEKVPRRGPRWALVSPNNDSCNAIAQVRAADPLRGGRTAAVANSNRFKSRRLTTKLLLGAHLSHPPGPRQM